MPRPKGCTRCKTNITMRNDIELPELSLADYSYDLPDDRIATHPLPERDASRLLVADISAGTITHDTFRNLADLLPEQSLLVVNRTRVIAARVHMRKPTGGIVEMLLTSPVAPMTDPAHALASSKPSTWQCLLRGRNIGPGVVLRHDGVSLAATVLARNGTEAHVALHWNDDLSLAEILDRAGTLPLPPYLHREAEEDDYERYQTVYATESGSVAAPTAGLHFTDRVLADCSARGIDRAEVTLHVGLGTFQPVTAVDARDHTMHVERISIDRATLTQLVAHASSAMPIITAVGTTSLRTLESLCAFGSRLVLQRMRGTPWPSTVYVEQWEAFDPEATAVGRLEALTAVMEWMDEQSVDVLWGDTAIMLAPGATLRAADALITNFHQPGNTLMLLIAAWCGPLWKTVYREALDQGYRFLSYGDSSLLRRTAPDAISDSVPGRRSR